METKKKEKTIGKNSVDSKSGTWVSWNKNIQHEYTQLYLPKTEDEIADIISRNQKVRFFGSKQSSADIAAGNDVLLDLRSYNKILNVDKEQCKITIESGALLVDLIERAEKEGWCIPCLPDINTVTIGGAIATGTHGTSGHLLAEYISECRLILANGSIEVVQSDSDLMDALRVSIGTLGVLSEITFQCEPIYYLHLKEAPEKDAIWLNNIEQYLNQHDFLRVLWLPHTGNGYVIKGNKVAPDFQYVKKDGPKYLKHRRTASRILYKYTNRFPWFTAVANKLLYWAFFRSRKEHVGSLYHATVTKSRGSTLELAEWTIGRSAFLKVFNELKATINNWSNDAFVHIPMDVRFVQKDTSWLSYAYEEDVVTMGCVTRNAETADDYKAFKVVEAIFIKHGGRPHWGKRFEAKDKELSKLYPRWEDFKLMRKKLDPKGKFLNDYLKQLFDA